MKFVIDFSLPLLLFLAPAVHAADAKLEQWSELMQRELPSGMCAQNIPLRTCIKTTDQQCQAGLKRSTRTCIQRVLGKQPPRVVHPEQYKQFGSEVGDCAEDLFAIEHRAMLVDVPSCKEYKEVIEHSKWKPK
ncbi:MAG: hypothetical protein KF892_24350 [Rhizobacter sp.]|nr:hypothetical protein [Rhizobacter sp.]